MTACSVLCSTDVVCKLCRKAAKSRKSHVNNADRLCYLSRAQRRGKKVQTRFENVRALCSRMNDSCCSVSCSKPGALHLRVSIREPKAGLPAGSRRQSHAAAAVTLQNPEHFTNASQDAPASCLLLDTEKYMTCSVIPVRLSQHHWHFPQQTR